ncbi:DUF1353 domain-containing protein [Crenobacter cavernae]|uniref:DUF1353 domain-containing protein n=1 Tax=Crenobacter cavernae TaxID=2290923 RepID=A0A345Y9R9_9NEIS|nr:DUF1353 domain-containing protein [Crenobacter cavernae]AXK40671.1 DUF1353 domain-containing protein [Crenobacter cavernae]
MSEFSVRWVFQLEIDCVYNVRRHLPAEWHEGCTFIDKKGRRRLEIHPNGDVKVLAGYSWDGCTPKISVFDLVLGTPDGVPNRVTKRPKAYYASLLHDVLYQFLDAGLPLSRAQADKVFLEILTRDRFAPRWIYYGAVRMFGGVFRLFTRRKRRYAGKRIPLLIDGAA